MTVMDVKKLLLDEINGSLVEQFISYSGIPGLLEVMSRFPLQPYYNQLLIAKYMPKAVILAGKRAWEHDKRPVRDNERRGIVLFRPLAAEKDEPDENAEQLAALGIYKDGFGLYPVKLYDAAQTLQPRAYEPPVLPDDFENVIRTACNLSVIEDYDSKFIESVTIKSRLFGEKIVIRPDLSAGKRRSEVMRQLCSFVVDRGCLLKGSIYLEEMKDHLFELMSLSFGLSDRLKIRADADVFKANVDEKRDYICMLSLVFSNLYQIVADSYYLTFNEVAFSEQLIHSADMEEIREVIDCAKIEAKDYDFSTELDVFAAKIQAMDESERLKIVSDVRDRCLFTYPARAVRIRSSEFAGGTII